MLMGTSFLVEFHSQILNPTQSIDLAGMSVSRFFSQDKREGCLFKRIKEYILAAAVCINLACFLVCMDSRFF